jgi:hypothetical protein
MIVEQWVERESTGETEVLEDNLPQCKFVHHKYHELTQVRTWAAAVGNLSYGTANNTQTSSSSTQKSNGALSCLSGVLMAVCWEVTQQADTDVS